MKKVIVCGLALVVIAIIAVSIYLSGFSINNALPKDPLPKQYEAYREIEKGLFSANYQSALLFSSDNELRLDEFPPAFIELNNTVIVSKQKEISNGENKTLSKTYFKLDSNGNVIDSVNYSQDWPTDLGGFLINQKGYCSWMLDGKKEMIRYPEENSDLTEDSTHLAVKFRNLYQAAQYIFYYSHYDLEDQRLDSLEIDKAVFYINGNWVALLGKNIDKLDNQVRVKGKSPVSDMVNTANTSIHLDYFQKEHYWKSPRVSWGNPNGNSSPDRWEGSGYFKMIVNRDTLYFKQSLEKEVDKIQDDGSPYRTVTPNYYYSNSKLNFALFTNKSFELYIIKRKTL